MGPGSEQEMTSADKHGISRRLVLKTAGMGLAAAGALPSNASRAALKPDSASLKMRNDGTYATAPLAKDTVRLAVIQTRMQAVNARSPKQGLRENLRHMLKAIDKAFHFASPPDILQFHEFPLTGFDAWSKKEIRRLALEIPGEETAEIGKKAKEYHCYIVFGSYAVDKDWPNHVLSITTIIGPDGKVADKHWKARNIRGAFPGIKLFTTTIYDVLDEYREMYGEDAIIPVTRTPYGNLATSSVQREPELFRAFAMKGAEIYLRTAMGGFSEADVRACALYNGVYSTMCNNAISPGNPNFFEDAGGGFGSSMIIGPRGEELARARQHETAITTTIPIAAFRKKHRQPMVHQELYAPVLGGYRNPYGPNLFSSYQPTDLYDAKKYLGNKSRWR